MILLRTTLVLATTAQLASAYVTSPHVLPVGRQMKWLKELTSDLVEAAPGALSESQLSASHDLMYAWSHTAAVDHHRKECALQVESLLKRVIDERRAGNIQAELDTTDYNCLLEGWARSGLGEASALRTEQILEAMQEQGPSPDLSSFKACLMAWRHSGVKYAAVRAHRILNWMIRLYSNEENLQALPDADCFDIVLQLWSRSGYEHAPRETERLLGVMENLHRSSDLDKVKPRQSSFNAVLAAWSKSGAASAPDRVRNILAFMELLGESDPAVSPDSVSYTIVMNTLSRSPEDSVTVATKADTLLRHVIDVYKQHNDKAELKPENILFNTAIGLWAKTVQSGSYRKARSILDRQLKLAETYGTAQPDVFGWTSVLSSCAAESGNAEERNKAFHVALSTYRQMQKHHADPNHVTYGIMLKACARLHPVKSELRRKWVRTIFADAVSAGSVGDMVVSKLREAATPDLCKELLQGHSRRSLPAEWTVNVREQSEFRNRKIRTGGKRAEV